MEIGEGPQEILVSRVLLDRAPCRGQRGIKATQIDQKCNFFPVEHCFFINCIEPALNRFQRGHHSTFPLERKRQPESGLCGPWVEPKELVKCLESFGLVLLE